MLFNTEILTEYFFNNLLIFFNLTAVVHSQFYSILKPIDNQRVAHQYQPTLIGKLTYVQIV